MKPRVRAAHLGELVVAGQRFRVSYRSGMILFRPVRARSEARTRALALEDVFNLAEQRGLFGLSPVA